VTAPSARAPAPRVAIAAAVKPRAVPKAPAKASAEEWETF
jgi:hypothetical protein